MSLINFPGGSPGGSPVPLYFAMEIDGVRYTLPQVLITDEVEQLYKTLGEILAEIIPHLESPTGESPVEKLRGHDFLMRFHLETTPDLS